MHLGFSPVDGLRVPCMALLGHPALFPISLGSKSKLHYNKSQTPHPALDKEEPLYKELTEGVGDHQGFGCGFHSSHGYYVNRLNPHDNQRFIRSCSDAPTLSVHGLGSTPSSLNIL